MRNINYLCIAGLLLTSTFASCTDEQDVLGIQDGSIKVSAEMYSSSRTELGSDSKTITWCADDQIYLFDADGVTNGVLSLVEGAGTDFATFSGTVTGLFRNVDKALYPVPTVDGNTKSFEFPSQKTWSSDSAAPMIGDLENNHVQFRNLAAMVRINLDGCSVGENSTLVLEMEGQAISGTAVVDVDEETLTIEDGGNQVTVTGLSEARFVDIPVPAGQYTGFTVKLDDVVLASAEGEKNLLKDDVLIIGSVSEDDEIEQDSDGAYLIKTSADLFWLAQEVNGGETFNGKTVKLASDINLANQPWTPIGLNADGNNKFKGVFDGEDHTIYNLYVNTESGYTAAGLFGALNGTVKNLIIDGATINHISSGDPTDNGIAVIAGSIYPGGTVKSVTVKNAVVEGNRYVGAIAGYTYGNVENCIVENVKLTATPDNLNETFNNGDKVGGIVGAFWHENQYGIKNNKVSYVTIEGYRDMGGIAGFANGAVTENKVENLSFIINTEHDYKNYNQNDEDDCDASPIIGDGSTADESNTASGITYYVSSVLGLTTATNHAPAGVKCDIIMTEGSYPAVLKVTGGKNLSFSPIKEGDVVVLAGVDHQSNGTPSNVVMNDLIIDNSLQTEGWYTGTSQKMKVCVGIWGGDFIFNNCHFIVSGESKMETGVMTWWTTTPAISLVFNGCTFEGKNDHPSARAMQIYGNVNMEVTGCTFSTFKDYSLKYVGKNGNVATFKNNVVENSKNFVELGSSVYPGEDCVVNFIGSILANGINNYVIANEEGQTVNVDDKKVYPQN